MNLQKIETELNAKIAAFDALAEDENATPAKLTELGDEIKTLKASYESACATQRSVDEARAAVSTPVAGASGVKPAAPRKPSAVENPKANFEDDPKKGFATPREFFAAVLAVSTGEQAADERMSFLSGRRNQFSAAVGSDEHSRFSDPHGGFLVPAAFINTMLSTSWDGDPMAGRTTAIPMAAPSVDIPARVDKNHTSSVSGGFRVYRTAEGDTAADSRSTFETITYKATQLMGVTYATEQLLRDSAITVLAMIENGFREEFASVLVEERLTGSGVGKFLGVLNSPALVTVAKESGQAADTINYDNVLKMRSRVWRYGGAIWMANHDALPQLAKLSLVVGTGGAPVWVPSAGPDIPDMLMGRPIIFHEHMETLGDLGDIICCNWSQYLEGTRQGVTSDESVHVRFLNNERTFRFTMENAGAPWWRSALTPKKSSSTLSPFVALAARA